MAAPTSATPLKQPQPSFGSTTLQKEDMESQHIAQSECPHSGESKGITAMRTITPYESTKFKVLLLFSILGVLTLHSGGFATSVVGKPDFSAFVQSLIVQGLARSCVPMCFTISGFLFFVPRADDAGGFRFWRRISARVKSLGIPYMVWNVVGAVQLYALVRVPFIARLPNIGIQQWLHPKLGLLLVDMWVAPAAGQLWYLRDLFLLCLLTPFFHYLFRIHHLLLLQLPFVVMVPWLCDLIHPRFSDWGPAAFLPFHVLRYQAVLFFTAGCYLALRGVDTTFRLPGWHALCLLIAWLSIATLHTALLLQAETAMVVIFVVRRLVDPLGVVAMWFGYDLLHEIMSDKWMWPGVLWLSNYSMWIYCMHDPVTEVVATAGRLFAQERAGNLGCLLFVLCFPLLIVIATLLVGVPLSRSLPGLFGLLTGGRGV